MNITEFAYFTVPKIHQFLTKLDGRYKSFVSDEFLRVYLLEELWDKYREHKQSDSTNIAYSASIKLFESLLEYGCKAGGNGHHVAQEFSSLFQHGKTMDELMFESILDKAIEKKNES